MDKYKEYLDYDVDGTLETLEVAKSVDRNIINPLVTGATKFAVMTADVLTSPNMAELGAKRTGNKEVSYEVYKEQLKNATWKNSDIRKSMIEKIKENRAERLKYINTDTFGGKATMFAHGVLEGLGNPINYLNGHGFIGNLALEIMQGLGEGLWEKSELEGKDLSNLDAEDKKDLLTGALTTAATHGVIKGGSKVIKKGVSKVANKLNDGLDIPLNKLKAYAQENGKGAIDTKAVVEVAEMLETGERPMLPRAKNNALDIENTFNKDVAPRLLEVSKEVSAKENIKKTSSFVDAKLEKFGFKEEVTSKLENDIDYAQVVNKTLAATKRKVAINQKQILAKETSNLGFIHMENGGNGAYITYGDLVDKVIKETNITGKDFKKAIRGLELDDNLKVYGNYIKDSAKEYVNFRYGNNLSDDGFNFDLVYNKKNLMTFLNGVSTSGDVEAIQNFTSNALKKSDGSVYLSEYEASKVFKVGKSAGMYKLDDASLVKKLSYDINATTKSIKSLGDGKEVPFEVKTWKDVAIQNAPLEKKAEYFDLKAKGKDFETDIKSIDKKIKLVNETIEKKGTDVKFTKKLEDLELEKSELLKKIEEIESVTSPFEKDALKWLDEVMDGLDVEVDPAEQLKYMTKYNIDEKSGHHKFTDSLKNFFDRFSNSETKSSKSSLNLVIGNKTFNKALEDEYDALLSGGVKLSSRKYSDMSFSGKTIYNTRNFLMWKYITNLNYIKETFTNKARINGGLIDLGFRQSVNSFESSREMIRASANVTKKFKNIKLDEIRNITNTMDSLQIEKMTDIYIDNLIDMQGAGAISKTMKTAGDFGTKGQFASDIQRKALAEYKTLNGMFSELTEWDFDNVTPTVRQVFADMGIRDAKALKGIQDEIKAYGNVINFTDAMKDNSNTSKVKLLFEQFSDIAGRELNAYDIESSKIISNTVLGNFYVRGTTLFRSYSMNNFNRILNKATSYIDSDGFTRYRFLKDGKITVNRNSFTGLLDWRNASRIYNSTSTALQTTAAIYGIKWATGKLTGATSDDMVELKMDLLANGEYLDVALDVLSVGMVENTGLDIALGGQNIIYSYFEDLSRTGKRMLSSNLSPTEKLMYSSAYVISPMVINRGIDHIKFEKGITSNPNLTSKLGKKIWNFSYKKKLEREQGGNLPYEALVKNFVGYNEEAEMKAAFKKELNKKTDYKAYFDKNPKKAEDYAVFKEGTPQEVKKLYATGLMESIEEAARNEQLQEILATVDDPIARDRELKEYGLDIGSIEADYTENRKFEIAMALSYSDIRSPESVLLFFAGLEYINDKETRKNYLLSIIPSEKRKGFNEYIRRAKTKRELFMELYNARDKDSTESYIEFLNSLRGSI